MPISTEHWVYTVHLRSTALYYTAESSECHDIIRARTIAPRNTYYNIMPCTLYNYKHDNNNISQRWRIPCKAVRFTSSLYHNNNNITIGNTLTSIFSFTNYCYYQRHYYYYFCIRVWVLRGDPYKIRPGSSLKRPADGV